MMKIKRLLTALQRRLSRLTDWRLVRWNRLASHQQRWYLRRFLKWQPIDLVLDVGGNAGQFAQLVRAAGYQGWIISFEPLPDMAAQLRRLAEADGRWQVVEKALGEQPGRASLQVTSTSPMSSLLEPVQDPSSAMAQFSEVRRRLDVELITLDDFLREDPRAQAAQSIYLKLDVQGFEMPVLNGARRSLGKVAAIQAELGVATVYHGQTQYRELLAWLHEAGYVPSLFTAHDYELFPEMIDFDAHFVRADILAASLQARQAQRTAAGLRQLDA